MRKVAVVALLGLAWLAAGCGEKADTKKGAADAPREQRWEKADANRDGKLSRAEAATGSTPGLSAEFDKIDANKDGFLTREERDRYIAAKAKK
jgi:hypothetical protein